MAVNNFDIIVAIGARWDAKSLDGTVTGGLHTGDAVPDGTALPYALLYVMTNTTTGKANKDDDETVEFHEVPFEIHVYSTGGNEAMELLMDAIDTVHFYASPISPAFVKYSRENVYWLTLSGGAGSPLRMAGIEGNPSGGQVAADFAHSSHHEQQMLYWLKVPGPFCPK